MKHIIFLSLLSLYVIAANCASFTIYAGHYVKRTDSDIPLYTFNTYFPTHLTLKVDDELTFKANDLEMHWATFYSGNITNNFNSTLLQQKIPGLGYYAAGTPDDTTVDALSLPGSVALSLNDEMNARIDPLVQRSWTVTVKETGTFTFACPLHPGMKGNITVISQEESYPMTPTQVDDYAKELLKAATDSVPDLLVQMKVNDPLKIDEVNGYNTYLVYAGFSSAVNGGHYDAFYPNNTLTINVGDSIAFTMKASTRNPHTISFNSSGTFTPIETYNATLNTVVLRSAGFYPAGDATNYNGGYLNSGFLPPTTTKDFVVTFTAAGTFPYTCFLHDSLGMTGVVTVVDRSASTTSPSSSPSALPSTTSPSSDKSSNASVAMVSSLFVALLAFVFMC